MYVGFLNESVFWNLQTFQWSCAIETGLDFLKMGKTVMKMHYPKRKPRIITYRKYKNFCNEIFLTSLQHEVDKPRTFLCENGLDATSKICTYVIENHAPRQKRCLRANHKPFTNPEIL